MAQKLRGRQAQARLRTLQINFQLQPGGKCLVSGQHHQHAAVEHAQPAFASWSVLEVDLKSISWYESLTYTGLLASMIF